MLIARGVPVHQGLPAIEGEDLTRPRPKDEVVDRALALCLVALKGEGLGEEGMRRYDERYNVAPKLTPQEQRFVSDPTPSDQDRIDAAWRYESLWVLLWALGFVEVLDYPDRVCDVSRAVGLIAGMSEEAFRSRAQLRSLAELLDQADLSYRYDWACVDAKIRDEAPPAGLDPGVVYERHYALNWLIGYQGQEWDQITTDT